MSPRPQPWTADLIEKNRWQGGQPDTICRSILLLLDRIVASAVADGVPAAENAEGAEVVLAFVGSAPIDIRFRLDQPKDDFRHLL